MATKVPLFFLWLALLLSVEVTHGNTHEAVKSFHTARKNALVQTYLRNISISSGSVPILRTSLFYTERCAADLKFFHKGLKSLEPWALTMFDASTKIPEGLFSYSFISLGNFDECIEIRDVVSPSGGTFHGRHCLISIDLNSTVLGMLGVMTLKIAVCLPSSCGAASAADYVTDVLEYAASQGQIPAGTILLGDKALDRECHTKDQPELETKDWITVGILIFFGVLVVLSTSYDILKKEERSNILLAFSLATNGKKLLAISHSAESLDAVHGIRFLSMAWVVMGHRYADGLNAPYQNTVKFESELIQHWQNVGISNGTLSVDSFFLMSGLLVSYVFFKQIPKTKSFNIPMFYLHRYLRLTPPLAIMILLSATLLRYSGSGPLWETLSFNQQENCRTNWWTTLLYVQNYVDPLKECVGQTWYLAVDMQLHWLSPLVLIPLWKWPRIGAVFMALLSVAGLVITYLVSYNNKLSGSLLLNTADNSNTFMSDLYVPTHTRFIPYLIGVATGYLLVEAKKNNRQLRFPTSLTLGLWLVSAALMLLALVGIQIFNDPEYEFEPVGSSIYNALHRPVWALGLAIVIYLCCTGHGGYVNAFLSWEVFQPLGRLSYTIYLTHLVLQLAQFGSARTVGHLSGIVLFPQFLGDLVLSIFFSAALSLVFESPFIVLENELFGNKKSTPSQPVTSPETSLPKDA